MTVFDLDGLLDSSEELRQLILTPPKARIFKSKLLYYIEEYLKTIGYETPTKRRKLKYLILADLEKLVIKPMHGEGN
ncbi:hypothetical protein Molly5_196 [Maribacter phage Molly_5]|uniref:Uncharacterized protein n=1 Tax=Maribacter phage Molly_1 TaxID=2745685 RepID=A0A8E4UYE7_9CAUD|nr:hypothetical protein M1M29_gp196 [Maribacter phage Molly_1]QQO97695.1 hypothetical protein Molly2_196 [Maribacter phage Molly_2]QQO97895.1 hypothetical protein Molly3_196 [Maribacter phage Molly_3]QQO98095.1 hypothetical protein Molly4_196 [Maribacter phage Molly_4]QQO98295.1 hypothetical protein Molly5_196 [Maribacter phage Molly_5]QQO97495.1 hypothetical protein Molly1_196 [Maribacter phage Molly_1]